MQGTEAFLLAVAGLAVGMFFFARARSAQSVLQKEREAVFKLTEQLEDARSAREREVKQRGSHAAEVAELRKRLEKAKRRAAKAEPSKATSEAASALSDLESQVEEARQARDEARQEAEGLSSELSRLRKSSSIPQPPVEKPVLDNGAVANLQKELEAARSSLTQARAENEAREKTHQKLKRKVDTQELLYVSMRSELDAKKDRLRTQQEELERLMALKAVLHEGGGSASVQASNPGESATEPEEG